MWRRVIAAGEDVWLARDEAGALLGFANAGPQREPDILPFAGEIYALYLLQAAKGRGLGRALMRAAARGLLARGIGAASLWVLDGNQAAQGFYAALGGQVVLRRPFPPPQDWDGHETAFAWPDLRVLAA
jgi:ribosomal protein S18 acetylase RimI-like enzyme